MATNPQEKSINLLEPQELRISNSGREQLSVHFVKLEKTLHNVIPTLMFPLTVKRGYIYLADDNNQEIGIIRDLDALDPHSLLALEQELEREYFVPSITRINRIEERFGTRTWDVETEQGHRNFDVRSRQGVRYVAPDQLVIKDVDGNRYEIPATSQLDHVSRQLLETAI